MKACPAHFDVPVTVGNRVVWQSVPCTATPMQGSRFCMWHHRPDFQSRVFDSESRSATIPWQDGRRGLGSVLNATTAEAKYNDKLTDSRP